LWSFDGMIPPTVMTMSPAPCFFSWSMSCGTSVLCPATASTRQTRRLSLGVGSGAG
jgi:hypothetical protein